MMTQCPSCATQFEVSAQTVTATLPCPGCGRLVIVRDASIVAAGGEATVPFDDGSALLQPLDPDSTRAGGGAAPLPAHLRLSLALLTGPRAGDVVTIQKGHLKIGREGGDADLQLVDPGVSRSHALVEVVGGQVLVKDLGSKNGTFVGDERVDLRELSDRDEFRIGATTFMLIVAQAE